MIIMSQIIAENSIFCMSSSLVWFLFALINYYAENLLFQCTCDYELVLKLNKTDNCDWKLHV